MPKFNHVCVIDDDPIYTYLTEKVMKMVDFSNYTEFFENGEVALNSLKPRLRSGRNLPDLILLDLNMPMLDGWQFLDEFIVASNTDKKVTIHLVTSSIDPKDREKAEKYSVVDKYIVKPITPAILQEFFDRIPVE